MDPNVPPCDDFYQFACGGFINTTIIPGPYISEKEILHKTFKRQLRLILEDETLANETRHVRLVKSFYKSCTNYCK